MTMQANERTVAAAFEAHFGAAPQVVASAPGRVNLLGEHTDYNGGLVLPMALKDLGVAVAAGFGAPPATMEAWSETFQQSDVRGIDEERAGRWSDYLLGCAQAAAREEIARDGLRIAVSTSLPLGAGLSSSAALEVATLQAITRLFGKTMSPVEIALTARAVENDFVGMPCGIMDQFASSVGAPGTALFLDTRTLEYAPAPALPGHRFVVVDSGVSHKLTDSGYATRVAECRAACKALGVAMLSDLGPEDADRIGALAEPLNRRARHIVTDNRLTREGFQALMAGDAATFGRLMIESHASERDDYQITVTETDALAAGAVEAGALGARQTGGGFGGAVVALVAEPAVEDWCAEIASRFPATKVLAVT